MSRAPKVKRSYGMRTRKPSPSLPVDSDDKKAEEKAEDTQRRGPAIQLITHTGPMAARSFRSIVQRHLKGFAGCLSGNKRQVMIKVVIGANGTVKSVSLVPRAAAAWFSIENCLKHAVGAIAFPKAKGETTIRMMLTLN